MKTISFSSNIHNYILGKSDFFMFSFENLKKVSPIFWKWLIHVFLDFRGTLIGIITAVGVLVFLLVIFVAVVLLCKSKYYYNNHTMYYAHWSIQSDDLDNGRMFITQENEEAPKIRQKTQVQCHLKWTLGKVRQN